MSGRGAARGPAPVPDSVSVTVTVAVPAAAGSVTETEAETVTATETETDANATVRRTARAPVAHWNEWAAGRGRRFAPARGSGTLLPPMDRPTRPSPSGVREHVGNGVLELRVQGEQFVLEHAREVVRIVFEGPETLPRNVAMDLENVRYINSSGISVLIRLNVERKLAIVGLTTSAREVLDLAGVLPFLTLVPNMEAARDSFKA